MNDRIPAEGKAGRMLITPENGSAPFYATVTMADEPLDEGTPLTKATLLKDSTAALLGGDSSMVPDEAISILKDLCDNIDSRMIRIVTGSYVGDGTKTKTLNFDGDVVFLIVTGAWGGYPSTDDDYSMILNPDHGGYGALVAANSTAFGTVTKSGNSITWETSGASANMSGTVSGSKYHYIAFLK